jgi:exonuclease I
MPSVGSYLASDRAKEKQESRARDELRVDMAEDFQNGVDIAEDFQNGFFSKLDRSKVRIVRRRVAA